MRTISPGLAGVVEQLELEQPALVTMRDLSRLVEAQHIGTPPNVVAARLRQRGWLLKTGQRGVWEFAPAAVAGPYSANDPVLPLTAFLAANPRTRCALTFQSAAWAHGAADRVPARLEVAAVDRATAGRLPESVHATVFTPHLDYIRIKNVPVLAIESLVVHISARPTSLRSWAGVVEWLPDVTERLDLDRLAQELRGRSPSVRARTGYLLQGLRPDAGELIRNIGPLASRTWFGPRSKARRYDWSWQIEDTILPFDPRTLGATK